MKAKMPVQKEGVRRYQRTPLFLHLNPSCSSRLPRQTLLAEPLFTTLSS